MPRMLCPNCKATLDVPDALLGKTVACSACKKAFAVPGAATPVPTPTPVPVPLPTPARREPQRPQPAGFDWEEIPRTPPPSPWDDRRDRVPDVEWPRPRDLARKPLPKQGPDELDDLGEVLASMPLFGFERMLWFGISALVLAAWFLFCGFVFQQFSKDVGIVAGFEFRQILFFAAVLIVGPVGFIFSFLRALKFRPMTLWLCSEGLAWQRNDKVGFAFWPDVHEVRVYSLRTIVTNQYGVVVEKRELHRCTLTCYTSGADFHVIFSTENNRDAKAFRDVLEYEALCAKLPLELRKLNEGKSVKFDDFTVTSQGVEHKGSDFVRWSELATPSVKDGELTLKRTERTVWAKVKLEELRFAALFIRLIELGISTYQASRPAEERQRESDNPFAF